MTHSDSVRVVAVDWSGRRRDAHRFIWCAEARDGELVRLECGRSRDAVADHLLALAADDPALVVGFDFSFSLPAWYLRACGYTDVADLWEAAALDGERWIEECRPPFWGRAGTTRPDLPAHLRATEQAMVAVGGIRPKSTFQIAGAGTVGTGSLRGFPVLARLRAAGFSIWPFDAAAAPAVVEIWPRALTGPVVKTQPDARAAHLDAVAPDLASDLRALAIGSDDAFDAALSALVMARHAEELTALPRATDPQLLLEGIVWCPAPDGRPVAQAWAATSRASEASTSAGSTWTSASSPT